MLGNAFGETILNSTLGASEASIVQGMGQIPTGMMVQTAMTAAGQATATAVDAQKQAIRESIDPAVSAKLAKIEDGLLAAGDLAWSELKAAKAALDRMLALDPAIASLHAAVQAEYEKRKRTRMYWIAGGVGAVVVVGGAFLLLRKRG
jgi:hypothetical protein